MREGAPAREGRLVAARIGRVGVWASQLQWQTATRAQEAIAEIESLGFGAVWVGEATGKEILTHAAVLLAAGGDIVVATGIASIWGRDPMAMANGARTLQDAYPERFLLGLGVSHPFLTEKRDRQYEAPLVEMGRYLDAMDRAPFAGPPVEAPPRVLAALGPKMLGMARDRAAGAHPYFVPVEHTAFAREVLGPGPVLAPEQAVLLEPEAGPARRYIATYLALPNYVKNLRRLGWGDEDLVDGGSDRLMNALVARDDARSVMERVGAHLDRGADHVAIRVLGDDPTRLPLEELKEIGAALAGA